MPGQIGTEPGVLLATEDAVHETRARTGLAVPGTTKLIGSGLCEKDLPIGIETLGMAPPQNG